MPGKDLAVVLVSNNVILVDLPTGKRRVLADAAHGSGDQPTAPTGLVVDLPRNRVLTATVFDDTIVAIDLTTGDRAVIAAPGRRSS